MMDKILKEIETALLEICGMEEIDPELDLFENDLLDSLNVVRLLVEIDERLGVYIAITEIERAEFSSLRKIVECVERKIRHE